MILQHWQEPKPLSTLMLVFLRTRQHFLMDRWCGRETVPLMASSYPSFLNTIHLHYVIFYSCHRFKFCKPILSVLCKQHLLLPVNKAEERIAAMWFLILVLGICCELFIYLHLKWIKCVFRNIIYYGPDCIPWVQHASTMDRCLSWQDTLQ